MVLQVDQQSNFLKKKIRKLSDISGNIGNKCNKM